MINMFPFVSFWLMSQLICGLYCTSYQTAYAVMICPSSIVVIWFCYLASSLDSTSWHMIDHGDFMSYTYEHISHMKTSKTFLCLHLCYHFGSHFWFFFSAVCVHSIYSISQMAPCIPHQPHSLLVEILVTQREHTQHHLMMTLSKKQQAKMI